MKLIDDEQKHRDGEAKLLQHLGQNQWECELYVLLNIILKEKIVH
jgi:hypothetical protein